MELVSSEFKKFPGWHLSKSLQRANPVFMGLDLDNSQVILNKYFIFAFDLAQRWMGIRPSHA